MEIGSKFCIQDITDWWGQQEEMHSMYANLSNVANNLFFITLHGVEVEASFSLGQHVIGWRQPTTTGETFGEKVFVKHFTWANNGLLVGDDLVLDMTNTDNDLEMKREREQKTLYRMAKVYDILETWWGSQTSYITQKESHAQNMQITVIWSISDIEEILKVSCSNFQHDGAAAFEFSERSPVPPALSAKVLPGGWTQVLNIRQIKRIERQSAGTDDDSQPESILDTENELGWNGDLDNPTDTEDNWEADNESETELDNGVEHSKPPEQRNVSDVLNIPGLIQPTLRLKKNSEQVLMMVGTMEMWRNKGIKKQ